MRILFVSPQSSFTEQLVKAFEQNGVQIVCIDDRRNYLLPDRLGQNRLMWRLVRKIKPLRRLSNRLFAKHVLKAADKFKPDILFVNKSLLVKPPLLAEFKSRGIKTVNWFPENANNEPYRTWLQVVAPEYDYFFSFDSAVLEQFPKGGSTKVRYIPFAVDPASYADAEFSDADRERYSCNICFVGAPYPERVRALELVKDMGLRIYGWKGWEKTTLAAYYHGPLNTTESAKAYRCAKICVNTNLEPPTNGVNVKTFEIPAAGGFQLSDYRKDIEGLFLPDSEISLFRDFQELRTKARYYLEDTAGREAIAAAGHARVLRDHTLKKRVREMLEIIENDK